MPGQLIDRPIEDEENYISSEDEDFDPENAQARPQPSSESEAEEDHDGEKDRAPVKGKRQPKQKPPEEAEDLGFENSGDEGIIQAGTKEARHRKRKRRDSAAGNEDSGGEGGFVKTRSMRAAADPSSIRKPIASTSGAVTTDINALWARLSSSSIVPQSTHIQPSPTKPQPATTDPSQPSAADAASADLIPIQRTYTFAGQLHTETKLVPRSSAQAQVYLATRDARAGANKNNLPPPTLTSGALTTADETTPDTAAAATGATKQPKQRRGPNGQLLFRPLKRRSHWEPNPQAHIRGLPPPLDEKNAGVDPKLLFRRIDKGHLGRDAAVCWPSPTITNTISTVSSTTEPPFDPNTEATAAHPSAKGPGIQARNLKAQKLNVVDKSKLDWAEHVDAEEGAREELEKAKRDKGSYLERKDFLERVGERGEEGRRVARGAGR